MTRAGASATARQRAAIGSAKCARGRESAGGHSEQERWTKARVGRSGSVARVGRYSLSDNGEEALQRAARQRGSEGVRWSLCRDESQLWRAARAGAVGQSESWWARQPRARQQVASVLAYDTLTCQPETRIVETTDPETRIVGPEDSWKNLPARPPHPGGPGPGSRCPPGPRHPT